MNQMNQRDLQLHITILGWLYIVGHIIFLIAGVFVFVFLTGIGVFSGDRQAAAILGIVGTFVAGLLTLLAVPGIAAGYGLLTRRAWGRILAIVVGILNLVNFPVGTVVGVYTLWVLLQDEASVYFGPQVLPDAPKIEQQPEDLANSA